MARFLLYRVVALAALAGCLNARQALAEDIVDFNRDVRPILSNTCFQCHGPDDQARQADLRLDEGDSAFTAKDGHTAIVPGEPDQSEMVRRLFSSDASEQMPPADFKRQLTDAEKTILRNWVKQGAKRTSHWAFVPPVRPPVPRVAAQDWPQGDLDRFILARMEQAGLTPSAPADKITLLRRVSLDLIGLPPTPQEVDAFLADTSSDAFRNVVERLLASEHYGERWGRIWLDAARYADSDGYEKDKPRQVYFYRDWVVQAFNRDLPYDQFLLEQLAGDLLPNATQDQIVATGFLRNSMINEEGGVDPEQFRMEAMFDRMDAIGKGMLGLTVQCSQCHSHKYDPLTQQDYYGMFAFFNNDPEGTSVVYTPAEQMLRADLFRQIGEMESMLQQQTPDWLDRMSAWEASLSGETPVWQVLNLAVDEISTGGQKYLPQPDGSLLAQSYAPTKHTVKLTAPIAGEPITGIRLELMTDENLPCHGPGRSIWGTAALTEISLETATTDAPEALTAAAIESATADLNLPEAPLDAIYYDKTDTVRVTGPIGYAMDGKHETAWGTDAGPGRRNQPRNAVFRLATPITPADGLLLRINLTQNHGGWNSDDNQSHNLGRFRLSVTSHPNPQADPLPAAVRAALSIAKESRSPEQVATLFSYWRTTLPEWQSVNDQIEALWKQHPAGASQMTLGKREFPRGTNLLERGNFLKPKQAIEPGVPGFLNAMPADAPRNRLGFAQWLTAKDAPTTARAFVNRVWQAYFGTGLVATAEELGSQGQPPTHPELLDWLSVEFMDHGWSVKHLHRLIALSAVYQQSSAVSPERLAQDPYNMLLARGPRFRVDAESVRDIALAASGLLNPALGGPSVYTPAPAFLFEPPASYGPKVWKEDTGPNRYRRALYTFRYRSVPYPALAAFDAPNGDFACVRRSRSNTPLQALTTLNEPLFLESAQALALKAVQEGGSTPQDRLTFAFKRCLARAPEAEESAVLLALLEKETARFASGELDPWQFATRDPAHPPALPEGVTPASFAGWTAVARVLLNLDETITKE